MSNPIKGVGEARIESENRAKEVNSNTISLEQELVTETVDLTGLAKTKARLGVIKKYADKINYSPTDYFYSSKSRLDDCIRTIDLIIKKVEIFDKPRVRLSREQSEDREIIDEIVNEHLKSCVTNHLNAMVPRHYKRVIEARNVINTADKTLDNIEKSGFYTRHKEAIKKEKAEAQRKAEQDHDFELVQMPQTSGNRGENPRSDAKPTEQTFEEFVFVEKPDVLEPQSTQKTQSLSMFQRIKNALTRTKPETSTNIRAKGPLDGQGQSRG